MSKVNMDLSDYMHIKRILEWRAKHLYDAESLEVLERLRVRNKHMEEGDEKDAERPN